MQTVSCSKNQIVRLNPDLAFYVASVAEDRVRVSIQTSSEPNAATRISAQSPALPIDLVVPRLDR
jgi:hypothetical protein